MGVVLSFCMTRGRHRSSLAAPSKQPGFPLDKAGNPEKCRVEGLKEGLMECHMDYCMECLMEWNGMSDGTLRLSLEAASQP